MFIRELLFLQFQRRGSNQEAKDLIALIDLYTQLQQEMIDDLWFKKYFRK